MSARIVFLGTPEAAVPSLEHLADAHDVALVVTQPDRPRGRSGRPMPPPVKVMAEELGMAVAQPGKGGELAAALREHGPFDLGAVVAYGRILDLEVLGLPRHGFLNVHFSLLPRWRGAAPVARALMAGDPMAGVTIIRLDEGLDTGPVLTAQAIDIAADEDAGALTTRLSQLGARLLTSSIDAYLSGDMVPFPQTDDGLTVAAKIDPGERVIAIDTSPAEVVNQIRALAPRPGAKLVIDGEPHKILAARAHEASPRAGSWQRVGEVPVVGLAGGGLELVTLQRPGKTPQSGEAWARGRHRDQGVVA